MDEDINQLLTTYDCNLSSEKTLRKIAKFDKTVKFLERPIRVAKPKSKSDDFLPVSQDPLVNGTSVFDNFDQDHFRTSIGYFPLYLKLNPRKKQTECTRPDVYDPRFVLPLLWHALNDRDVEASEFIKRNGLSYVISSLSSHEPCMRVLGYSCLQKLYRKLEKDKQLRDRIFWMSFIDIFRCHLTASNQRLQRLVSSFLFNAIDVVNVPKHSLFEHIKNFMVKHEHLSPHSIGQFLSKTLRTKDITNHFSSRMWAMKVLSEGIDEEEDFKPLLKNDIFDWLMMSSISSDNDEKLQIHNVFRTLVQSSVCARRLCIEKGFISFILQESLYCENYGTTELYSVLVDIVITLCGHWLAKRETYFPQFVPQILQCAFVLMHSRDNHQSQGRLEETVKNVTEMSKS